MFPTGDYDRLYYDVLQQYNDIDIPITFGVLIADYDQRLASEYIINYLDFFDMSSGKYIDFFIPGYIPYERYGDDNCIPIHFCNKRGEQYYFNREVFHRFITEFGNKFGIKYPYNPILVLVELTKGNFANSRKIIIDLDSNERDIKRTGVLFDKIFSIAKQYTAINDFEYGLARTHIKGDWLDAVVRALDNSIITELRNQQQNVWSFRVQ